MNKILPLASLALASLPAWSDDVRNTDRLLCSQSQVLVCVHSVECLQVSAEEVYSPQFVIVDTRKKTVSTTKASGHGRSSGLSNLSRDGGLIMAQGSHGERVFSFVIDEATGTMTGSVASDGYTINTFGSCTDADVD